MHWPILKVPQNLLKIPFSSSVNLNVVVKRDTQTATVCREMGTACSASWDTPFEKYLWDVDEGSQSSRSWYSTYTSSCCVLGISTLRYTRYRAEAFFSSWHLYELFSDWRQTIPSAVVNPYLTTLAGYLRECRLSIFPATLRIHTWELTSTNILLLGSSVGAEWGSLPKGTWAVVAVQRFSISHFAQAHFPDSSWKV